jgi:MFS family permease
MRGAFGTPSLARLQLALAAVSLGEWSGVIVLAIYAYDQGGAAAVGLVSLATLLPGALLTPLTSLIADRFARRDVLLGSAVLRTLLGLMIAAAVLAGLPLWAVVVVASAKKIAGSPYRPAQAALLPQLASSPRQMAASNALWNGLDSLGFVVGALLGGLAIAALDAEAAFGIIALPYALAALLVVGIARDAVPRHRERLEGARMRDEALAGFSTVVREPQLRPLVGVLTASKLVEGAVDTMTVLVALELLDMTEAGVGFLNAAWGVGGIAGMVVALGMLHRGTLAAGLAVGCLLIGLPLIALAGLPTVAAAAVALLVLGVGYALVEIAGETLAQRLASDEVLARVFGVVESTYTACNGIGAALAPALVALAGIEGALVAIGAALPLVALTRWRVLARYEAGAVIPERPFELLRAVPLFAPLPVASVENLSLRLNPVTLAAGDEIVRQGDAGERFFIVDRGSVEVLVDGEHVREEGPGGFFGEIALLRAVPRTATVRAIGETELLALDSDEFIAGVTGNPRAVNAADAVIDERIATAG